MARSHNNLKPRPSRILNEGLCQAHYALLHAAQLGIPPLLSMYFMALAVDQARMRSHLLRYSQRHQLFSTQDVHRGKATFLGKRRLTGATGEGTRGTGTGEIRAAARGNTLAADTASEAAKPPAATHRPRTRYSPGRRAPVKGYSSNSRLHDVLWSDVLHAAWQDTLRVNGQGLLQAS